MILCTEGAALFGFLLIPSSLISEGKQHELRGLLCTPCEGQWKQKTGRKNPTIWPHERKIVRKKNNENVMLIVVSKMGKAVFFHDFSARMTLQNQEKSKSNSTWTSISKSAETWDSVVSLEKKKEKRKKEESFINFTLMQQHSQQCAHFPSALFSAFI